MQNYGKKLFGGGDPFMLRYGDTYYVYCTTENDMSAFTKECPFFETGNNGEDGIEVHISKDLVYWENGGYCLKRGDVLGTHGFWAPEVSYYNGKFYMIYTANEHPAIAVSDSPTGPFRKLTDNFLRESPSIDGHLFFDSDGSIYVYFVELNTGNHIRMGKMTDDLTKIEWEHDKALIRAEDPWETIDCKIAEGPFVLKHNGLYYLTYSCNHTRCSDYAVGYAVSESPTGPFRKYSGNPILHRFGDIVGTGHHSFMPTDDPDKFICIYHCHSGNPDSFKPRKVCLAEAEFVKSDSGEDVIVIRQ